MDIQKINLKFEKFLDERIILDAYQNNIPDPIGRAIDAFPKNPELWILGAFDWYSSPEGGPFWNKIDNEWHSFLMEEGYEY